MNAHITTNRTISTATLARTAVLALALINQILSALGKPLLPIDSTQLEQLISTVDPTAELAKAAIRFCGFSVRTDKD